MKEKKQKLTTFTASLAEALEAVGIGSVAYLVIVGLVTRDLASLWLVALNGIAVAASTMIADDWAFKKNNVVETLIWQEYVGLALAYGAVAGYIAMVYAETLLVFVLGIVGMIVGAVGGFLWFLFPYTWALLKASPATLDQYDRLRYERKLKKADAKGRKRILAKIARWNGVADDWTQGSDLGKPFDPFARSLRELKWTLCSPKALRDASYKASLQKEIQMVEQKLDSYVAKMGAAYGDKEAK